MVPMKYFKLTLLALAWLLGSCAAPKAIVIEKPRTKKAEGPVVATATEPAVPTLPDDGLRLPDMLAMPGDGEFRATSPNLPKTGPDSGAVISRPPTDPPSRPKPKDP
jgi:hypothetical protein